jgi:hypothetical protein
MVVRRTCKAQRSDGESCRAAPLSGSDFCAVHDPANAETMAEARRLGGVRRKRELTVAGAYDFEGLTSVDRLRRLLDIAAIDALGLENSIARVRAMVAIVLAGAKLLETGELEERVKTLEAAVLAHRGQNDSLYDQADDFALEND